MRVRRNVAQHSEIREMPWIVFRHASTGLNGRFAFNVIYDIATTFEIETTTFCLRTDMCESLLNLLLLTKSCVRHRTPLTIIRRQQADLVVVVASQIQCHPPTS
jgi:hypothetical protein